MNTPKTRLALLGIAFGVLLALLLAPQTRWLVKTQVFPSALLTSSRYEEQKQAFVRQYPNDYQIQLAGQTRGDSSAQLGAARRLVPHFPDNASLRANILRYATAKDIRLSRDEDFLLSGQPVPPPHADPNNLPPTPAHLAAFDADAAAGEKLDPDNAYFPFMRAFGLFAAHRDAEGLAAVQRASTKHVWREYFDDEVEGDWRIDDSVYGGRESVSAMAVSAALLFPHYQHLRAEARVVAYKAILDEKAGHAEAGLAKRQALGRCGALMGTQSTVIIGNLVGVAINAISRTRPGGSPPIKFKSQVSNEEQARIRLKLYTDYVTKIGHPEAAAQAQRDNQTWQQIHSLASKVTEGMFGVGITGIIRLTATLAAGWVLFPNILSMLLLGFAAYGLSRLPQIQECKPLSAGATLGFWGAVIVGLLIAGAFTDPDWGSFAVEAALLIPLTFAGMLALTLRRLRRPIGIAVLSAAVTVSVGGVFGLLMSWQMHGGADTLGALQQTVSMSGDDHNAGTTVWNNPKLLTLLGAIIAMAIPLLTAIILSIVSRVKRVPVSVGLVNGFRAVMPPLVCGLMLVYGGLVLWTVQQEARANYGLERSLHGEGQYLAQLTGQEWPK